MTPEVTAAFITIVGTIALTLMGQLVATVYFAGRLTERVANHGQRITALENAERQDLIRRATLAASCATEMS